MHLYLHIGIVNQISVVASLDNGEFHESHWKLVEKVKDMEAFQNSTSTNEGGAAATGYGWGSVGNARS